VTDERSCVVCGADLSDKRADAQTCGPACRRELSRRREHDALMDPNPSSALAMTSRLSESADLSASTDADAESPDRAIARVQRRAQRPLSQEERAALDPLRILAGGSAFVVAELADLIGRPERETADLLGRAGVAVQDRGVVDGRALERALSVDGRTMIERELASRPPVEPMPVGYEPTPLHDTEGLYSAGRVIDSGGDPFGLREVA
jgi:hypothetical protein